jgi:hypothetical protein
MANANIARGLIPYRHINGQQWTGAANIYYVPATDANNIFPGDPVKLVTNSADGIGIPVVTIATAGGGAYLQGAMVGIAVGGESPTIAVTRDLPPYRQASVATYILVADDPDLQFLVQEDGVGGAMVIGAGGRNVDLVAGAGSTVTGYSGWQLDSSTLATTNTLQMRLQRLIEQADNAQGLSAKWLASINLHSQRNLTGV